MVGTARDEIGKEVRGGHRFAGARGIPQPVQSARLSGELILPGLRDGDSQAVPDAQEEADERQSVVARHAIDRMREATAAAGSLYRQWRESVEEATALREQLTVIRDCRAYPLLQLLCRMRRVVIPPGSFRERLLARWWPVGEATAVAPAAAGRSAGPVNRGSDARGRPEVPELDFSPLCWHLKDAAPPDAEMIRLIILSPNHRSGSTLLQRICNARKGTLIWGEHGGLLSRFADIYMDAAYFSSAGSEEHREYFGSGEDPNLWIANMCPALEYVQQAVVDSARAFLGVFYGQFREHHDILGFKEVAYGCAELELLRRCYPRAQILFLVRNPLHAWRSTPRSWYPSLDDWATKWNDIALGFHAFARHDAGNRLIRYEDLIRKEPATMAVLAQAAKVSDEQVSMVLAHKLGSHDAGLSDSERGVILGRCRQAMETLGYV